MPEINGWPGGVNNIAADVSIPTDENGDIVYLRDAVNVDVLDEGKLRLRPGITQKIAASGAHSVYSNGKLMVWATADTLRCSDENLVTITILTDTRFAEPVSFEDVNGDIYFTNPSINGIIHPDGTYEAWGLEAPAEAPDIVALVTGPNLYSITCTFVTGSGQESGAPAANIVYCADNPSFQIFNIPQPTDPRITTVRIYMTNIDGVELQEVVELPVGITIYSLSGFFAYGNELTTQFMLPPPKGQLIELADGILYIASGNNVYHTEPLNYGLYDPTKNYFMYPERVTLIKHTTGGLYVSADQLHFLKNAGADGVSQDEVMPYRAVEGAICDLPDSKDFVFMSDRGFVRASVNGEVENLTEKNIAVDTYSRGAMGYTSVGGHEAIVAMFKNPVASNTVSEDYTKDINSRKQLETKF